MAAEEVRDDRKMGPERTQGTLAEMAGALYRLPGQQLPNTDTGHVEWWRREASERKLLYRFNGRLNIEAASPWPTAGWAPCTAK